jgi:predicted HicB family RNase H-like nuclease
MKNLDYYKGLNYNLVIEEKKFEGKVYYICYANELGKNSCYGEGNSYEEAIESFKKEKDIFIEYLFENDKTIPEPSINNEPFSQNGFFNVRTSPQLHSSLAYNAKNSGISLNSYVNIILSQSSILDEFSQKILPHFNEIKNQIKSHDCNVKQQFMNFWLNLGMRNNLTTLNEEWRDLLMNENQYDDLAA